MASLLSVTQQKSPQNQRASVIKSPTRKLKLSDSLSELDANIVSDKPTGIFMPSSEIDVVSVKKEKIEPSLKEAVVEIKKEDIFVDAHNLRPKKSKDDCKETKVESKPVIEHRKKKDHKRIKVEENIVLPEVLPIVLKEKKRPRRRKAINRTGNDYSIFNSIDFQTSYRVILVQRIVIEY